MSAITGRVTGRQAIKATLAAMPAVVRAAMGEAIRVTASEIVRAAIARVPVDTGTLLAHIGFSFSPSACRAKVGITPGTVVIGRHAYRASHYAHLVEFGAPGQRAQPFLDPAFRGELQPLDSRMQAAQRATLEDLAHIGSGYL